MKSPTEKKKKKKKKIEIRVLLFFILIPHIKIQDPISNRSWLYVKCNPWTDGRTHGQAQTNMPPQLLRIWGLNNPFKTMNFPKRYYFKVDRTFGLIRNPLAK